jgi:hypothetical protein
MFTLLLFVNCCANENTIVKGNNHNLSDNAVGKIGTNDNMMYQINLYYELKQVNKLLDLLNDKKILNNTIYKYEILSSICLLDGSNKYEKELTSSIYKIFADYKILSEWEGLRNSCKGCNSIFKLEKVIRLIYNYARGGNEQAIKYFFVAFDDGVYGDLLSEYKCDLVENKFEQSFKNFIGLNKKRQELLIRDLIYNCHNSATLIKKKCDSDRKYINEKHLYENIEKVISEEQE